MPYDVQFLSRVLLATAMGIMLWSLCRRGGAEMRRSPQLWAASIGFIIAWTAQSLPQMALHQPLSQGMLLADYVGLALGQLVASLYLILAPRLAPHPQSPVSCVLSRQPYRRGGQTLVLLTSENEWSLPKDRGRDLMDEHLRLVA